MKRLAALCLVLHMTLSYCNDDKMAPPDGGYKDSDTFQNKTSDTSSYERMPNKATDSTPQ